MSLAIPSVLATQVEHARVHRIARCWKITSVVDTSKIFRFTDHHKILTLFDSQQYTPVDAIEASAVQRAADLQQQNRETRGIVASSAITETDLKLGIYEGAEVIEYEVDWMFPWAGAIAESHYWIEDVTFDQDQWVANIIGLGQFLTEPVGDLWGPSCRTDLFSGLCGLDAASFAHTNSVLSVTDKTQFTAINSIPNGSTSGYYTDGKLTWNSGANKGTVFEIESATTSEVVLREAVCFDIQTSDSFTMLPGCNKQPGVFSSSGHCKNKFSNLVNFQGEPYIPGRDEAIDGLPLT